MVCTLLHVHYTMVLLPYSFHFSAAGAGENVISAKRASIVCCDKCYKIQPVVQTLHILDNVTCIACNWTVYTACVLCAS